MKRFLLFILVLLVRSIPANACGFYPYGEEIRYCFFKPEFYDYYEYSEFDYSANYFDSKDLYNGKTASPNELAWSAYCSGKVSIPEIREAVYRLSAADIHKSSTNGMIRYLYAANDVQAINYLQFAKQCEPVNGFFRDPWERNENELHADRRKLIKLAGDRMKSATGAIRMRYGFLTMRMCRYNQDQKQIKQLYEMLFADAPKDLLHYWALYFYSISNVDGPLASFYAAQVFANAPDKRFAIYGSFDRNVPLSDVLAFAKTKRERANVYLLAGIRHTDPAFDEITKMYELDPGSEGLEFLLLREVNKIEDWVYTPYYSLFEPSVYPALDDQHQTVSVILERVEKDRQYAARLLSLVESADYSSVKNPIFWKQVSAQLLLITQQYSRCIATVDKLQRTVNDTAALNQLHKIKAIALTASQKHGNAVLPEYVKPLLLANKSDRKFLFAIGRELEYKGNMTQAALLYSLLEYDWRYGYDYAFWKSAKNKETNYYDYFSDYFTYLNFVYTPEMLTDVIKDVESNTSSDTFSAWQYTVLKNDIDRLYDLLGVKYIRLNKLAEACDSFSKVSNVYWDEAYGLWERSDNNGRNVFDRNPFYQIKYTVPFAKPKENYRLNKYSVARQLIEYLRKAEDPRQPDRDYYYFLVANCYLNMTNNGNSWMMRRFSYTGNYDYNDNGYPTIPDEKEYGEGILATHYYTKALQHAKTDKFRALCARMIERDLTDKKLLREISASQRVYDDLNGNCTKFADYFAARR